MTHLRPDEMAYETEKRRASGFNDRVETGVNLAKTVALTAGGAGLASKIAPFLSEFISPDIAVKAISKVSPQLGKFLKNGKSMGLDVEGGLNYLKERLNPDQPQKSQQDNRNIIEQYSPELHQFIQDQVGRGMTPEQAAAIAFNDNKFRPTIEKITKDHRAPFSKLIQMVYGQTGQSEAAQPQSQQPQAQGSDWSQITETLKNILGS